MQQVRHVLEPLIEVADFQPILPLMPARFAKEDQQADADGHHGHDPGDGLGQEQAVLKEEGAHGY